MKDSVDVTVDVRGPEATVRVSGELDEASCGALEPRLLALMDDDSVESLCLDLTDVSFIDSSGLSLLVRVARRALRDGMRFGVSECSEVVQKQFDRTRLSSLMATQD